MNKRQESFEHTMFSRLTCNQKAPLDDNQLHFSAARTRASASSMGIS
jgi:hypothetical protein